MALDKNKAIETAVNWWVEKLKSKPCHDNGDNSLASIMACIIADKSMTDISEEQLDTFKTELKAYIEHTLDKYRFVDLYSDYGPGVGLHEAAKKANINTINFPYKTGVKIDKNGDNYRVLACEGYGCGYTEIGG